MPRVVSKRLYEDDDEPDLTQMRNQNGGFTLDQENAISQEVTPEEIPDIRRLGALQAIQDVPGVSNAESANIEATPTAPPADPELENRSMYQHAGMIEREPEPEQEEGFLSRLGGALKNFYGVPSTEEEFYAGSPAARQAREQTSRAGISMPTPSATEPESQGLLSTLGEFYGVPKTEEDFYAGSPAARKYAPPEVQERLKQAEAVKVEEFNRNLEKVRETGEPDVIQGELEALENDPNALAQFEEVTGINYDEQLKEELQPYVDAATSATEALDDEAMAIRQRIAGGGATMTDQDKLMLGLAVIIPTILAGLIGGKTAAVAALGGGLQGLGKSLAKDEGVDTTKALKRLSDIEQEKLGIQGKTMDAAKERNEKMNKESEVKGSGVALPKELEGFRVKRVIDPKTGKEQTGIRTKNDLLLYDAQNISKGNAKEDIKDMNEAAKDALKRMKASDEISVELDHLESIYKQLEEAGYSGITQAVSGGAFPGGSQLTSPEVIDPLTGKKENAVALVNQLREKILDKYRTMLGGNRALTSNIQEHFNKLLANPFEVKNLLTISQARNLAKSFKGVSLREFVNGLEADGFLREPLEKHYLKPIERERLEGKKGERQKQQVSESSKIIRQNPEKFKSGNVVEVDL